MTFKQLTDVLGIRRLVLALFGGVWLSYGCQSLFETAHIFESPHNPDLAVLDWALPVEFRAFLWGVTGTVAIAALLFHEWEPVGWSVLWLMPVVRIASYLWSFAMWLIPGAPGGSLEAIFHASTWAFLLAVVVTVARWPQGQGAATPNHTRAGGLTHGRRQLGRP